MIIEYIFFSYIIVGILLGFRIAKESETELKESAFVYVVILIGSPIILPVIIGTGIGRIFKGRGKKNV